ncbi:MAG: hypothetical protein ACOCSP_02225 [archaeon]
MSVESAVFVDDLSVLDELDDDFDRLYFGNEFCDKRLPEASEVRAARDEADRRGVDFSYVTPIVTPTKLEAVEEILTTLESIGADDELIFNDWGVYALADDLGAFDSLVAGRVLSRQKRDPTVTHLTDGGSVLVDEEGRRVSERVLEHFQKSSVNAPYSRSHLAERGIDRVELDVLSQGVYDEDISFSASLYYPWNFLTVKRWCRESTTTPLCNEACEETVYSLDNQPVMPETLYRKNNAVFVYNETVPDVSYVDREVFVPDPIN